MDDDCYLRGKHGNRQKQIYKKQQTYIYMKSTCYTGILKTKSANFFLFKGGESEMHSR